MEHTNAQQEPRKPDKNVLSAEPGIDARRAGSVKSDKGVITGL
jgi:hypothetical protein